MESIQEVSNMLARAGSFYYRNLSSNGTSTARKLTQFYTNCRVFSQLRAAGILSCSGGYFSDYERVIHFSDKDVDYFGTKYALQQRTENGAEDELILKDYVALTEQNNKILTELDREARLHQILTFPYIAEEENETVVGLRSEMRYGLYIDPDVFVTTILKTDGTSLINGVDFLAYYGLLLFTKNPIELFPGYKLVASSCTVRKRNLLSFTLGVDDVYGPVDRIMTFYRVAQSPRTFYYAAAQAIGLCVVPEDCTIISREPLHKGCSYITSIGKLDAPYNHIMLEPGDPLSKDTVIGGEELFSPVYPGDSIPETMGAVNLDYVLPVKGLYAPNSSITISVDEKYDPAFEGTEVAKEAFRAYIRSRNDGEAPSCSDSPSNAISYVRDILTPGRALILRINRSRLYRDMQLRLDRFIDRELPIGVALLTENMINDF